MGVIYLYTIFSPEIAYLYDISLGFFAFVKTCGKLFELVLISIKLSKLVVIGMKLSKLV